MKLPPRMFLWYALALAPAVLAADPEVLVPDWKLEVFIEAPGIVTPVGIAVDGKGRVFVVENHTHQVKAGYPGPSTDRIRVFEDADGDGKADRSSIFAEGFTSALTLAFDPDGILHMVHRNGVLKLEDRNSDGVCDTTTTLLRLETPETYPHNGLSGIAFAADGWIYVGSGENFGVPFTAIGADGTEFPYIPGGANVFRIRRDGSRLERFATGMWNAFVLTADGAGRILAVDNDPDSRPPCRLLHVVAGADFGYHFQYGRSGLHPFVCWNGELPGTLPMAAGTGEAPTGILDARLARLGPGRESGFLLTEWGDSTLAWYRLQPNGASISATREVVIRGDSGFRPACLAAARDGSVYISDWADREYSVHQKGRIWRLSSNKAAQTPSTGHTLPLSPAELRREALSNLKGLASWAELQSALPDPDPFIRNAALHALQDPVFRDPLLQELRSPDALRRLVALLALHRQGLPDPISILTTAFQDLDPSVRREALRIAATLQIKELRPMVEQALKAGEGTGPIRQEEFAFWLAAMDLISRDAPPTAATATVSQDDLLQGLLAAPGTSPEVKAAVLPQLTNFKAPATIRTLMALAVSGPLPLRQEAVRSLGFVQVKAVAPTLWKIALDSSEPPALRADSIQSLSRQPLPELLPLFPLLGDADPDVVLETVRAFRMHASDPAVGEALGKAARSPSDLAPEVNAQLALALSLNVSSNPGAPPVHPRPASKDEWSHLLLQNPAKGNPERGRRVFYSATALCSSCHVVQGRGIAVGPDLSTIARSADRTRLVQSILHPSREIGPLYVTKAVTLRDGQVLSGVQSAKDGEGTLNLLQLGGTVQTAPRQQILKSEDTPVSLMPEGLENAMTVEDLRDLLAWLGTLR